LSWLLKKVWISICFESGFSGGASSITIAHNEFNIVMVLQMGFSPFAKVVGDGMTVVDKLYSGYGEGAPGGSGPDQSRIQSEGNKYLKKQFPNMSYVKSVRRVDGGAAGEL